MLDWFMTIPGLLITCGVILLIVALVLFILGNKKEKTTNNIAINTGVANQPLVNDEVATVEPTPVVINTPVEDKVMEPVSEPSVIDFGTTTEDASVAPTEYDFSISEAQPVVEETPVVEPVTEEVNAEEPEVTIYGGNNPLENTQVVEEANHEPYGGVTEATVVEPVTEPVVEAPKIDAIPTISIPEIEPVAEQNKEEL